MLEDKILISNVKIETISEDGVKYDVQTDVDGVQSWYICGTKTLHRRGKPAIIHPNGDEYWYCDGQLHRALGPAISKNNGAVQYWYNFAKLERLDGGPAVIDEEGKFWYKNHLLNRDADLPAAEWANGLQEWYSNGSFQKDNQGRTIFSNDSNLVPGASMTDPSKAPHAPVVRNPKTQKARSILNGCLELQEDADYCYTLRGFGSRNSLMMIPVLIQTEKDILDIDPSFWTSGKKIFARPCPMTPRHGFIDSRVIKDKAALRKLYNRTKKIDPEGEIVLTTYLEGAVCNAILTTSGTLSIGPGHDGATAGKGSFSIPVKPDQLRNTVRSSAGVVKYDNCFVEAVFTPKSAIHESFYFTQVRGGPIIDAAAVDFIPAEMAVQKVIPPNDDLVAWESQVKKLAPGTVVYGPGHTLASHAAIHCVINNIAFITSFEPKVGELIKPVLTSQAPLSLRDFKVGVTLGIDMNIDMCHMLHTSMAIIHNWVYIRNSKHSSWLLGLAAGFFTKVMCTLSFGEYRYAGNSHLTREEVYKVVYKSNKFGSYMKNCPKVAKDFTSGGFQSGYGGQKWAKATYMCIDIWNLMADINASKFDINAANKMVETLNKATNLVHNNGWLFNKISSKNLMNFISSSSGLAMLQLGDVLFKCHEARQTIRRARKISKIIVVDDSVEAVPAAPAKTMEAAPPKAEKVKKEADPSTFNQINKSMDQIYDEVIKKTKAQLESSSNKNSWKQKFNYSPLDYVYVKQAKSFAEDMLGYPTMKKDNFGASYAEELTQYIKDWSEKMNLSKGMSMSQPPPPDPGKQSLSVGKSMHDLIEHYGYSKAPYMTDDLLCYMTSHVKYPTEKTVKFFDPKDLAVNSIIEESVKADKDKEK